MTGVVAGGGDAAKTGNIVCDLDGVVYLGDEPVPGAGAALTELERQGFRILLVTNNSTRTAAAAVRKVEQVSGYHCTPDRLMGSGHATVELLAGQVQTAFVVGEPGLYATLENGGLTLTSSWQDADVVVVGLDRKADYARLCDASLAVRGGARFVATNVDATFPTPQGQVPGCGALVAFIAEASGVAPEVAGKPHEAMRRLVRAALGSGPTYVVGDRVETDLEMGRLEGWQRVLVMTGVTDDSAALQGEHRPELVLASLADLPGRITPG